MVTDSVARTFFLLLMIFVIFWPKVGIFRKKVLATLSVTMVSSLVTEVANRSHQP